MDYTRRNLVGPVPVAPELLQNSGIPLRFEPEAPQVEKNMGQERRANWVLLQGLRSTAGSKVYPYSTRQTNHRHSQTRCHRS